MAPLPHTPCLSAVVERMLLVAIGWLILVSPALAQDAPTDSKPEGTVTAKLMRYCERTIRRHDSNGDGHLDAHEWSAMRGQPAAADLDGNGQLTVAEFARYVAGYGSGRRIRLSTRSNSVTEQAAAGEESAKAAPAGETSGASAPDRRRDLRYFAPLANGTPGWFVERDADGDAQLTLSEFSPRLRSTEVAEFKRYDINGDGLLTAAELARAASKPAGAAPANLPASPAPTAP